MKTSSSSFFFLFLALVFIAAWSGSRVVDGCSPVLSCSQIQSLAQQYFPSQYVNDMICIAYYESSWCPSAYNGICCYGLWQINENHLGEQGCPSTTEELLNPEVNAQCAAAVLSSQGLNAWQTWTEGKCNGWNKCTSGTSSSGSKSSSGNSRSSGSKTSSSSSSQSSSTQSSSTQSSSTGSTGSTGSSTSSSTGSTGTNPSTSSTGTNGATSNPTSGIYSTSSGSGHSGCVMDRQAATVEGVEGFARRSE